MSFTNLVCPYGSQLYILAFFDKFYFYEGNEVAKIIELKERGDKLTKLFNSTSAASGVDTKSYQGL